MNLELLVRGSGSHPKLTSAEMGGNQPPLRATQRGLTSANRGQEGMYFFSCSASYRRTEVPVYDHRDKENSYPCLKRLRLLEEQERGWVLKLVLCVLYLH